MSIFASDTTATVALPFDAPHTVTLQKLTGRDLEVAQAEHMSAFISDRRPRGWAALFQRALREGTATQDLLAQAQSDPLAGFDRLAIVRGGLKAWTYTVRDDKGVDAPMPITAKAVADIDDEALEFLAVEIMRLTKPALFQTPEESAASQKKS